MAEMLKLRPFQEPRNATHDAWDRLAAQLATDSKNTDPNSEIRRTGAACCSQFDKLLAAHRKEETQSLQKTGSNEQINEHIQNMTDLVALVDDFTSEKVEMSKKAQKKENIERISALEMCDAGMRGLVDSNMLTDLGQLEDATVQEKQGQRKRGPTQSDKENIPIKRPRDQNVIVNALQQCQIEDEKLLNEARACDEAHHQQLISGIDRLTGTIDALVNISKVQLECNAPNRISNDYCLFLYPLFLPLHFHIIFIDFFASFLFFYVNLMPN
ncbi:hypothetical protein M422DRAFT_256349 [Sphaerobolus stellatus SS14]|uniref:Uncharacterized protein n=1 Tax=Sphaerobolus stellatus (strain SS14) TaxID=990650 RepID=A0A0C9UC13_SPHS4|nr:hypothetical protein M422DRAFT_256349 [Sphaerobolus stellatus SS14]